MFFEGSLQDGISTALQESKQVVCFVTDGGTESQQWEDEFLTDGSIRPGLESQSVSLRLVAGSEEAGYLEALFPIPKKPTIVVIQNGQLKEYIAAGTSKGEFIRRLGGTVQAGATTQRQPSSSSATTTTQRATSLSQTQTTAAAAAATPLDSSSSATESEEEKRLTAEQKGKGRAEAEEEARRRVDERCGCDPADAEKAHANEVKVRRQQANEERRRILKRIEDDKRARKEREAAERRARQLLSADATTTTTTDEETQTQPPIALQHQGPLKTPGSGSGSGSGGGGEHCNLQVRLLDGSTIRTRFPHAATATLAADVRAWVDESRTDNDDGHGVPYNFRVVLAPQPNRALTPADETSSLLALGLAPSATLVLTPARHSVAYAGARGPGGVLLSPVIGAFSSLCGAIMASIGGFFALFFGSGGGGAGGGGAANRHVVGEGRSGRDDVPMENLRARRRDAQLYNGNSLNFEPRNEDDDENTR